MNADDLKKIAALATVAAALAGPDHKIPIEIVDGWWYDPQTQMISGYASGHDTLQVRFNGSE